MLFGTHDDEILAGLKPFISQASPLPINPLAAKGHHAVGFNLLFIPAGS